VEQIIKQAIAGSDADYTEIRIEQEARSQVLFRKDKLENIEGSREQGGIVRALKDGGWGIAAFNDISDLPGKVKEATRMAQLVAARIDEPVELADVEPVQRVVTADLKNDFRSVPLEEKKKLIEEYNRILLDYDKRIVSTNTCSR